MLKLLSRKSYERRGAGVQGWEEMLEAMIASGAAVPGTAFAAESLLCPDFNIPRFYMAPGRTLRFHLWGDITTIAGNNGTISLRARWGGSGGTLLCGVTSNLIATAGTAAWSITGHITCRATGSLGSSVSSGLLTMAARPVTAPVADANLVPLLMTNGGGALTANNPAVTDTTIDKLLSFTAQFSVTSAANIICHQRLIEALN